MENALVNVLLINLNEVAIKKAKLLVGDNDELQFLSVQLSDMVSYFLNDFDGVDQEGESLNLLVKKITNLVYDVEDIIDEHVLCHYYNRGVQSSQRWWFPRRKNLTKKHNFTIKRINELKNKMQEIYDGKDEVRIDINSEGQVSTAMVEHGRTPSVVEETDVVGFTNEVEILVAQLTGGEQKRAVISIIGMDGLGKTALANKIYKHLLVRKIFKFRAWVHVSKENTRGGLILNLLRCFMKETTIEEMHMEERGKALFDHLEGKKYLIVLDDVWKPQVWDGLVPFLPDDKNGSRILLTSRYNKVGLRANPDPNNRPHYLRFLDKEESWELFRCKAFPGEDCSQKWEQLGRAIVEKCGGLPLAIVFLGRLLLEKKEMVSHEREIYHDWSRIPSQVSTLLHDSAECKKICTLSYHDLPYYIRPCFLYLVVFPENYEIPARQLVQLWIAEGFIQKNDVEMMEDTGERYLEMLGDRGLIQVVKRRWDGGVKTCSIHCLYRDFCISEAKRERFLHVNGSKTCLQELADLPHHVNPRRLAVNSETIEHICAHTDKFGALRSFLCFNPLSGTWEAWAHLFKTIKFLKVFNVLYVSILPDEVKNLMLLRYLGLDKNSLLEFPLAICNMLNLQVLDARSKFLRSAPVEIWNLKKLRHIYFKGPTYLPPPQKSSLSSSPPPSVPLRTPTSAQAPPTPPPLPPTTQARSRLQSQPSLSSSWLLPLPLPPPPLSPPLQLKLQPQPSLCPPLRRPPPSSFQDDDNDPASLKNLQTLSTISADSCTSEVFRMLPNLLKLGVKVEGYLIDLSKSLGLLKKLHTLKLEGAADSPPLISLPLKFPPNLTKLTICDTQLQEDPMLVLGVLQKLWILKLSNNAYTGAEMVSSDHGFPHLRVLKLVSLEHIREIKTRKGAFPKLKQLVIHDCPNLELFTGLVHVTALQVADLRNPHMKLRQQMQQFQEKNIFQFQLQIYPL